MRGGQLALQIKVHTKTQRAPSDIFRLLFPSLKILLTPLYSIIKIIMASSVEPSLSSCALAGEKFMKEIRAIWLRNQNSWMETRLSRIKIWPRIFARAPDSGKTNPTPEPSTNSGLRCRDHHSAKRRPKKSHIGCMTTFGNEAGADMISWRRRRKEKLYFRVGPR